MNYLKNIFGKYRKEEPEDITLMAKRNWSLIENTVKDIFKTYYETLMNEHITYIVFAVWGAKKEGELTSIQKEINDMVIPVIKEVISRMDIKNIRDEQEYALDFFLRGLIIAKITYMIELARVKVLQKKSMVSENYDFPISSDPSESQWFNDFMNMNDNKWFRRSDDESNNRW